MNTLIILVLVIIAVLAGTLFYIRRSMKKDKKDTPIKPV